MYVDMCTNDKLANTYDFIWAVKICSNHQIVIRFSSETTAKDFVDKHNARVKKNNNESSIA